MTVIAQGRPARPIRIESSGKVPRGGTLGQALIKASGGDYDMEWGTAIAAAAWGSITGTLSAQADLTAALAAKQATLQSGVNIKTLNGSSILGSGDLVISASAAWGGITGTLSSQTDLQAALDVGSTRIPDDFVGENTRGLLAGLKVTAAASTRFAGAYRSRNIGAINWYFAAQAMTLAPLAFPEADRKTFCEVAIDKGVVSPRQSTTAYTASTMVTFASGKVFFCNIAGTTTSPAPSDAGATVAGDFLGDGTVTWEYTGLQVPASWQWFMVDIASNLLTIQAPDSTDSYPAMLASAAELANVDAAWLNTASAHPGNTRMQVINNLIQNGMTDDLTGTSPGARLSYVFQNQLDPAGGAYTVRYLADNVEVWRGYIAQAALLTIVGSSATAALQNAADVKTGILSTQLFDLGRFKAYVGRPNWDTITGDAVYETDFRFHLFPWLYGMLSGVTETQTYGDAVALYIRANVPGLFSASLGTFPMAEGFYALWQMGWEGAKDTLFWRVTSRNVGNVVISDAALQAVILGYTYADAVTGGGGITALTGDVTASGAGSVAAAIDKTAITGKSAVTAVGTDYVLISDTSDSGNLKKALASDFMGGGGGATGGTATLDFGAVPGSTVAEVVVSGQASIGTGSRIRAWVQGSTADHNAYEHSRIFPQRIGLGIDSIVAGVGFTICAETELRLTGEVAVKWEWA